MAKSNAKVAPVESTVTEPEFVQTVMDVTFKWGDKEHKIGDLPLHSIAYLIQNGAKQSHADSTAGMKKELAETPVVEKVDGQDVTRARTEDEIAYALLEAQDAKWVRILDGSISTRTVGPRKVGIEKFIAEVAMEQIKKSAAKQGKAVPKDEALKTMLDHVSKMEAVINEAKRRFEMDALEISI